MQFIYVLPGWEGSAADGRILRSAMLRENGLQVSKGNYYLVDVGYTNGEGFLASFRGQRYHLNTWLNGHRTEKAEEYFNMKHSAARNVIERCFGVLKKDGLYLEVHHFIPFEHKIKLSLLVAFYITLYERNYHMIHLTMMTLLTQTMMRRIQILDHKSST